MILSSCGSAAQAGRICGSMPNAATSEVNASTSFSCARTTTRVPGACWPRATAVSAADDPQAPSMVASFPSRSRAMTSVNSAWDIIRDGRSVSSLIEFSPTAAISPFAFYTPRRRKHHGLCRMHGSTTDSAKALMVSDFGQRSTVGTARIPNEGSPLNPIRAIARFCLWRSRCSLRKMHANETHLMMKGSNSEGALSAAGCRHESHSVPKVCRPEFSPETDEDHRCWKRFDH